MFIFVVCGEGFLCGCLTGIVFFYWHCLFYWHCFFCSGVASFHCIAMLCCLVQKSEGVEFCATSPLKYDWISSHRPFKALSFHWENITTKLLVGRPALLRAAEYERLMTVCGTASCGWHLCHTVCLLPQRSSQTCNAGSVRSRYQMQKLKSTQPFHLLKDMWKGWLTGHKLPWPQRAIKKFKAEVNQGANNFHYTQWAANLFLFLSNLRLAR